MKLEKWIKIMEEIAPSNLAQDYDNVGLLIGTEKEIERVLVALDLSVPVAEEAIAEKVDLIRSSVCFRMIQIRQQHIN